MYFGKGIFQLSGDVKVVRMSFKSVHFVLISFGQFVLEIIEKDT